LIELRASACESVRVTHGPDTTPPSDAFVWPPRAPDAVDPGLPSDSTAAKSPEPGGHTGFAALRSALITLERGVLRPTVEPVRRQAMDLNWARESLDAFCHRCGRTVGPHEEDEFGCANCRGHVGPIDRVVRLGTYAAPVDGWIWALKFQRIRSFGRYLGGQLALSLREAGALEVPPLGGVIVQAMPMSRRRRMSRGIHHSRVLAEACARELGVPLVSVLRRAHRPSQRSVPASDRWSNARGSVVLPRACQARLVGTRVILVDDVRTTGATARAAALALKGQKDARYSAAPWGAREVWHAIVASAD
jgi:predicted amidophosphoribosyltransferase